MIYLVIFIVAALVIGPVLWIRPSPREKQQLRLRAIAKDEGLKVYLRPIPHPRDEQERAFDANIMAYVRPWTEKERKTKLPRYFIMGREPGSDEWALYRSKNLLQKNELADIPKTAALLEINNEGVIVYWRESGDEDRVKAMAKCMEGVAQRLLNGVI